MGCGASGGKKKKACMCTEARIVNTWSASGKAGEGWTEITFNADKTCTGAIVMSVQEPGKEMKNQEVFKGEAGTWKFGEDPGQRIIEVHWTKGKSGWREFKEGGLGGLKEEDMQKFSKLYWNGTAGCSLIWCWYNHRQALFPTHTSMTKSEDHYYGNDDSYCYGTDYMYYGAGGTMGAGYGCYYEPKDGEPKVYNEGPGPHPYPCVVEPAAW